LEVNLSSGGPAQEREEQPRAGKKQGRNGGRSPMGVSTVDVCMLEDTPDRRHVLNKGVGEGGNSGARRDEGGPTTMQLINERNVSTDYPREEARWWRAW
jgi:hypothetical protein